MWKPNSLLARLLSLSLLAAPLCAQTQSRTPEHPLDALTTEEYWTAHDVLAQSGHLTDDTLVSSLLLHEPAKDKVLAWHPGEPIPREADLILLAGGKTYETRIDLAARAVEFWKQVPASRLHHRLRARHHERPR